MSSRAASSSDSRPSSSPFSFRRRSSASTSPTRGDSDRPKVGELGAADLDPHVAQACEVVAELRHLLGASARSGASGAKGSASATTPPVERPSQPFEDPRRDGDAPGDPVDVRLAPSARRAVERLPDVIPAPARRGRVARTGTSASSSSRTPPLARSAAASRPPAGADESLGPPRARRPDDAPRRARILEQRLELVPSRADERSPTRPISMQACGAAPSAPPAKAVPCLVADRPQDPRRVVDEREVVADPSEASREIGASAKSTYEPPEVGRLAVTPPWH